jgi:hypothetical protein
LSTPGHAIPLKTSSPDGSVRFAQEPPPLVFAATAPVLVDPTAKHVAEGSQVTLLNVGVPTVPVGRDCAVHVIPPSAVPIAESTPTARQLCADAHATPSSDPTPEGNVSDFHVAPPSVVPNATPVSVDDCPTAMQVLVDGHVTSFNAAAVGML